MNTPNGTVAVKNEVPPTQAALNAAWDRLGELTVVIDNLSQRLEPAISPAPTCDDRKCGAEVPAASPLTENIQRIGYSIESSKARLVALTHRLDL